MESETDLPNLPNCENHEPTSPTTIPFCNLCDKPFTSESSRNRHLRYCGSRTRSRPRSCRACNAAKTKCSFETPCARCTKRNIECVYDGAAAMRRRQLPALPRATTSIGAKSSNTSTASLVPWSLCADDDTSFNPSVTLTDHPFIDDDRLSFASGNSHRLIDLNSQTFLLSDSLALDESLTFEDYTSGQIQYSADAPLTPDKTLNQQSAGWCTWTQGNISLSAVAENRMMELHSGLLAVLQTKFPHAQHNADLVIQSLRSFPVMMLRKETFPWFIHPHSHLLSKPARASLPGALCTCMGIAQMFVSRTSETKPFLWSTIKNEFRRSFNEKDNMSLSELLATVQACVIYLIMAMIDQSHESEASSLELLMTLHGHYVLFKERCRGAILSSEIWNPSSNWEDWILAESQRRLANLWFLIGCAVCVKTGIPCDPSQTHRFIPLPSLKSLWEAKSRSAWESEYEASRILQESGLVTLGDLIDTQKSANSLHNAEKLDKWNAGIDNLGSLLNLVGTMV